VDIYTTIFCCFYRPHPISRRRPASFPHPCTRSAAFRLQASKPCAERLRVCKTTLYHRYNVINRFKYILPLPSLHLRVGGVGSHPQRLVKKHLENLFPGNQAFKRGNLFSSQRNFCIDILELWNALSPRITRNKSIRPRAVHHERNSPGLFPL